MSAANVTRSAPGVVTRFAPGVVTRFAPSPTGYLHLGSVRSALYNWLWARKTGGTYLLRVEDTDLSRSTDEATAKIFEGFQWLGLLWDGTPVHQAQRLDLYRSALDELWAANKIYPAFEGATELQTAREQAEREKRTYIYDGVCATLSRDEAERRMTGGEPFIWRLHVGIDGATVIRETLMSDNAEVTFTNDQIGDFPLTRSGTLVAPGMPLYNFCNVVDDHAQGITHVIRGVEHLVNTPKQALLYRAFGWDEPTFTHLPLILKNGKKMSKRDPDPRFAVAVHERAAQGYLPEALLNYIALLGWSPGKDASGSDIEFMTLDETVTLFDLDRLQKSNANFDEDKFLHFNGLWIRHLAQTNLADLIKRVTPFMQGMFLERFPERQRGMVRLVAERAKLLTDFPILLAHFFDFDGDYAKDEKTEQLFSVTAAKLFKNIIKLMPDAVNYEASTIESVIKAWAAAAALKPKDYMLPLRLAVSGSSHSAGGVFDIISLLGRDEVLTRLQAAIGYIEQRG